MRPNAPVARFFGKRRLRATSGRDHSRSHLGKQLFGQVDLRDAGGGEFGGDALGGAKQVRFHAVGAEGAPTYPRCPRTSGLADLARLENLEQRPTIKDSGPAWAGSCTAEASGIA